MKKNKGLFITLAVTGAVGGFAVFLFATKKGKKITKKLKVKGEELTDDLNKYIGVVTEDVKDFIDDSEKKFEQFKKNISEKFNCR